MLDQGRRHVKTKGIHAVGWTARDYQRRKAKEGPRFLEGGSIQFG